jgi:hypothetical protein
MGEMRTAHNILIGKLLGRPRRRYEGNLRMDLRVIGWEGVD